MSREAGFSLLEVLVAFVIAALALGALTQGAAGGLQSARLSGHYEEAVSRARSRLAALGPAPASGEASGDDGGGFLWRTTVTPIATSTAPAPQPGTDAGKAWRIALLGVAVRVTWRLDGGERAVLLTTERLRLLPPDPP